jgi:cytoskeletal protein CcmA (bactofilin family)
MFSKEPRQERIDTLIGKTARLQGDLQFAGGLHLDGRIVGNVTAQPGTRSSLSVSESGTIEGAVEVPNVMLSGAVKGDIHARERLVLGPTARVEGSVFYGVIEMTLGAEIMGRLTQLSVEPEPAPSVKAPSVKAPPVKAPPAKVAKAG